MTRLAVLASGSGTILEAMVACGVPVDLLVADRPCRALEVAAATIAATMLRLGQAPSPAPNVRVGGRYPGAATAESMDDL